MEPTDLGWNSYLLQSVCVPSAVTLGRGPRADGSSPRLTQSPSGRRSRRNAPPEGAGGALCGSSTLKNR